MTLTVTHTSSNASVGASAAQVGKAVGIAVSGQNQGDVFGSLLATLFGLVEQIAGQSEPDADTEVPAVNTTTLSDKALPADESVGADGKPRVDIPDLDIAALLNLTQGKPNADATTNTENPERAATPQQMIAALVKVLQHLEGSVDTAQLTEGSKAVDAISRLLTAARETAAASTSTASSPAASTASSPAASTASTPTANPAPDVQATAQVDALTKLAEKFALQSPELSAKLSQLADKLQQLAPPAPKAAQDAELHQTLQTLFGEKQLTGKAANTPLSTPLPTGPAKGLDQSAPPATSPIGATRLDLNATKVLHHASAQQTPAAAPSTPADTALAGAAAAANGAAPTAKSEAAPQTDALLLAQSNNQLGVKTDIAAAVKPMTAAYQTPAQNLNLPHIAFEIARSHQEGMSRFQIRLDPPEMGRIDVKLHVDGTGNLHARMTVERADTLDMLQRDARSLERALQQAGIESGRTNLEFSLRQNPFARQDGQSQGGQQDGTQFSLDDAEATTATNDVPAAIYYRGTASPGGINMFA